MLCPISRAIGTIASAAMKNFSGSPTLPTPHRNRHEHEHPVFFPFDGLHRHPPG